MAKTIAKLILGVMVLSGCAAGGVVSDTPMTTESEITIVESEPIAINTDKDDSTLITVEEKFTLPILAIHHVGEPPATLSDSAKIWYLSDGKFEELLLAIKERGYTIYFMHEILDYLDRGVIPEKAIVLTFDDAPIDYYTNAWPLLKKYNMKSSVYVMTGVRGENYLNKDQILELHETGLVEFQSHTKYHAYLTRISDEEVHDELLDSKEYLEALLNESVTILAYPFGLRNDTVKEIAKDIGYEAGLTIVAGTEQSADDLFEMKRNNFINTTNINNILD